MFYYYTKNVCLKKFYLNSTLYHTIYVYNLAVTLCATHSCARVVRHWTARSWFAGQDIDTLRAAHRSPRWRGSPVIPSPRSKHLPNYCQRPACGVSLLIRVTYARTVMRSRVSKQVSPKCGWCVRAYVLRGGGWGGYWLVKNQPLLGVCARWGSMFAK